MYTKSRILLMIFGMLLSACSYNGTVNRPGVYRIDIQQGNVLEQPMLDRLKPGMEKNLVEFILGTPAFIDPFHTEQWEYFFSMAEEGDNPHQRHLRVHFVDNKLSYISGNVVVSNRDLTDPVLQTRTVDVPADRRRSEGFFKRIINSIPFVGDDQPRRAEPKASEEDPEESEESTTSE
jgi:outer membrane protein assembly factor BamE